MTKKILIYRDEGADPFYTSSLLSALRLEQIDRKYQIEWAQRTLFQGENWQDKVHLVIFPGGRDLPYHKALKGEPNRQIADFVHKGGKFLGICAGGYYGSARIEFEQGGPLEVLGERELRFFPGIARGPAYGTGKFSYQSQQGAQIAKVISDAGTLPAHYNGGCAFVEAEKYAGVSVIARYADIEGQPPAIIKCNVGSGEAILSGVHPEYSLPIEIENERRVLFTQILAQLEL
jgi:biotin--protein ligase